MRRQEDGVSLSFGTFIAFKEAGLYAVVTTRRCGRVVGQLSRFARLSYDHPWAPSHPPHKNTSPPPYLQKILEVTSQPRTGAYQPQCDVLRLRVAMYCVVRQRRPPQVARAWLARTPSEVCEEGKRLYVSPCLHPQNIATHIEF